MRYEFVPYSENVSDDVLLSDLIRCAKLIGKETISKRKYNEIGKYHSDRLTRRFGSWNNALEKANLHISVRQFDIDELFENLEEVWANKGRQPTYVDMNDKSISTISGGAYLRRFGTWNNALKAFVTYMNQDELEVSEILNDRKKREPRSINLRLRWQVLQRDNYKCCKCGASPATDADVQLQVDHIIPWSKGGCSSLENLQTLCSKCNSGKSNLTE